MDEAERAFEKEYENGEKADEEGAAFSAFVKGFRAARRWRKWPEEKPKVNGEYLVTNDSSYKKVCIDDYDSRNGYFLNCDNPIAWMPKPAPYQPEDAAKAEGGNDGE